MRNSPYIVSDMIIEEFIKPRNLSLADLVMKLDLPPSTVEGILKNQVRISPRIADKFGAAFQMSSEFWLNLQKAEDKWWDTSEEAENFRQGNR